jgi:hypothetical protein
MSPGRRAAAFWCIASTCCVLVDLDQLLQAVYLHQLIDVGIWICIRRRVLILQLCHQQREEVVRSDHRVILIAGVTAGIGRITGRRLEGRDTSWDLHLTPFRPALRDLFKLEH